MQVEKYKPVGTVIPGGEPKITFRIIGKCNFHCPSCSTASHPERKGILRFSHFKKLIEILAQEKFRGVLNISGGEPSLHPRLIDMLRHAAKNLPEIKIVVFTNGSWIGKPWWRKKLRSLLTVKNAIIRMSLDRQHAEGARRASQGEEGLSYFEDKIFQHAQSFLSAALSYGAIPGDDFDFAFKGNQNEADLYMARLGKVPVYCIEFQKNPEIRPKKFGYFGVDIDKQGKPYVFPTLGHILSQEPLGGMETLSTALQMNRDHIK
jgi:organic radical activating enzyme